MIFAGLVRPGLVTKQGVLITSQLTELPVHKDVPSLNVPQGRKPLSIQVAQTLRGERERGWREITLFWIVPVISAHLQYLSPIQSHSLSWQTLAATRVLQGPLGSGCGLGRSQDHY